IDRPFHFVLLPSKEEGLRRVRDGAMQCLFVLPPGYLQSGEVDTYQTEGTPFTGRGERAERMVARILRLSLSAGRVSEEVGARLDRPIDPSSSASFLVRPDGGVEPHEGVERFARLVIPGIFSMLLLMSLLTSAGYLLQGVVEEKENRVVEVLLS